MPALGRLTAFAFLSSATAMSAVALSSTSASAAVVISTAATQNMGCSHGLCEPTAKDAVLNVNDLTSMLASGDVEVSTGFGSPRSKAKDIIVDAGFSWSDSSALTLDAHRSIIFKKGPVVVNGSGGVALAADHGDSGGSLSFEPGASLSFASTNNSLTINGVGFTLENSIAALASAIAANPAGNFALSNSYDASKDGTYKDSPISTNLQGTVEGLGNTISNLSIASGPAGAPPSNIGLFLESSGTIAGLALANLNYSSTSSYNTVGGLVVTNYGFVINDYASGSIRSGRGFAGGLVGVNGANLISSHASVSIRSAGAALIAGGLAGYNAATIELSSASGSVQKTEFGGGLVGGDGGSIIECFASGDVVSGDMLGGLVGEGIVDHIQNSYATGSVKNGARGSIIGGLSGETQSSGIDESYSTGYVSGGRSAQVGGLVGQSELDDITSSYWDITTSKTNQGAGDGDEGGITGLTSAQLRSGLPAGFDPTIWRETKGVNRGFPYLIDNPPPKN